MTLTEFSNTRFSANMQCRYNNKVYDIISVDFIECLIAIDEYGNEESLEWKRCENVDLIK